MTAGGGDMGGPGRSRRYGRPGGGGPRGGGEAAPRRPGWRRYAHGPLPAAAAEAWWGGDLTEHRFNLTLSVMFNNLINHFNPGGFVGNLNSPQFGQPTSINSGFGGGPAGAGGGFGGSVANNRRIEFQTRFTF
jgi:hypothetical protein